MTRKLTFEAGHSKLHWDFSTNLKVCLLQVAFCQTSVIFFLWSYSFWFSFSVLYSVFAAITMLSTLQPKIQYAFPFKSTCCVLRCNHPESLVKFRALGLYILFVNPPELSSDKWFFVQLTSLCEHLLCKCSHF